MTPRIILVVSICVAIVLGHFIARANPIEISSGTILSTATLCDDNGGLSGIKLDRYPPYHWIVYCEDGSDWRSQL